MRVLDLGAGGNPDIRATDCVDFHSKSEIDKLTDKIIKMSYYFVKEQNGVEKLKLAQEIISKKIYPEIQKKRYLYKIDYTKKLPYHDNTFDLVTSQNSLSYGYPSTYKHILRVLKVGGGVEISHGNKEFIVKASEELKKAGFREVLMTRKANPMTIFDKIFGDLGLINKSTVYIARGYK